MHAFTNIPLSHLTLTLFFFNGKVSRGYTLQEIVNYRLQHVKVQSLGAKLFLSQS